MRDGGGRGSVLVTSVGAASGAREIAAALACAGAEPDRATLMVELASGDRAPRPTLVATAAARDLEERLRAHLPGASVAARGRVCHLVCEPDREEETVRRSAPLVRDATLVVHAPAAAAESVVALGLMRAAVLRADLVKDRSLAALAVRGLMSRGLTVTVAKRAMPWAAGRMALFGSTPPGSAPSSIRTAVWRSL